MVEIVIILFQMNAWITCRIHDSWKCSVPWLTKLQWWLFSMMIYECLYWRYIEIVMYEFLLLVCKITINTQISASPSSRTISSSSSSSMSSSSSSSSSGRIWIPGISLTSSLFVNLTRFCLPLSSSSDFRFSIYLFCFVRDKQGP